MSVELESFWTQVWICFLNGVLYLIMAKYSIETVQKLYDNHWKSRDQILDSITPSHLSLSERTRKRDISSFLKGFRMG